MKINDYIEVDINFSPKDADIAIVSIDEYGTLGKLNSYVLKEYGYSDHQLPVTNQLRHGFSQLNEKGKKPILFVVTVSNKQTITNLSQNLYNTLVEFRGWFKNKKVWLPLLGTGDGNLSFKESYEQIINTIIKFQNTYYTNVNFFIAIPNDNKGSDFYKTISAKLNRNINNSYLHKLLSEKNVYLAGSYWGGDDQTNRFYSDNLWENGHDNNTYTNIINNIKINDIIILKSSFAKDNTSFLRISSVGVITRNYFDGKRLSVNWKLKYVSLDIPNLGYYRKTIELVSINDVILIFSYFKEDDIFNILDNTKNDYIPGLVSDIDKGIDYLDISKDVKAFSKVIAAKSFEPPLAIALFGKWGSGKSFFMNKLKEQIITLSSQNKVYCNGISHIHFNAWSYIDSNLWASLITKIFEGLNEYISENSISDEAKNEIKLELSNHLNISKEAIEFLKIRKQEAKDNLTLLNKKKIELEKDIQINIDKIKDKSIIDVINEVDNKFDVNTKIKNALKQNTSFLESKELINEIIPETYWDNPKKAYNFVKSKSFFLKEFIRPNKFLLNFITLGLIILLIIILPDILSIFIDKLKSFSFQIPQYVTSFLILTGAISKRIKTVYHNIQPIAASLWNIKENYENQIDDAINKFKQEEKAVKLEIKKNNTELAVIDNQIHIEETNIVDLENRINKTLSTEALHTFIEKRSKSDEYKKHLGIISIIRKDFEILNNLFAGHNKEYSEIDEIEIKNKLKKPLQRIILYIDDLDRCPDDIVVQVLEAVNLLMAFSLFVVIVGVDPRWIKNALLKKHSLQFTNNLDLNTESLEVSNFLEKIFQVPFHLKDAENNNVKEMIRQLAIKAPQIELTTQNIIDDVTEAEVQLDKIKRANEYNVNDDNTLARESHDSEVQNISALTFSEKEILFMQELSDFLGNNPRIIKRFINIYRIIKAHEDYNDKIGNNDNVILSNLFLLSLSLGKYKLIVPTIKQYLEKNSTNSLLVSYFAVNKNEHLIIELKNRMMNNQIISPLLEMDISVFKKNISFIERFTFKNL